MTEKIQELLAVLDAKDPEKKLQGWAWRNDRALWRDLDGGGHREISNADLAFRLRDEVSLELWERAAWVVETWFYFPDNQNDTKWILWQAERGCHDPEMTASFLQQKGKPIHFIIAALIAKELSKT